MPGVLSPQSAAAGTRPAGDSGTSGSLGVRLGLEKRIVRGMGEMHIRIQEVTANGQARTNGCGGWGRVGESGIKCDLCSGGCSDSGCDFAWAESETVGLHG